MSNAHAHPDLVTAFEDDRVFDRAFAAAYATAATQHKQAGVPLVVWRDGRVTLIPPHEIVVPALPAEDTP